MQLGNNLAKARKKSGLSQENVAEKLGVSRQTISKWELGETLPDIRQSKQLAVLYRLSLDELIDFDTDVQEIQEIIDRTSEEVQSKVDWNKIWGRRYPILLSYKKEVDINPYVKELSLLLNDLQKRYDYSKINSFLILKDILATVWRSKQ